MDLQDICLEIDIQTIYGWIKTFYLVDIDSLEVFEQWYSQLDNIILDTGLEISKQTLQYKLIKPSDEQYFINLQFIELNGKPFEFLEQIEDLNLMFDKEIIHVDSDTDSELYTQTETISNIISAHINGDIEKVKELLVSTNATNLDDEIIINIKNKYLY